MTQSLEAQFFSQLEIKELEYYFHILSFNPLRKYNLDHLFVHLQNEKESIPSLDNKSLLEEDFLFVLQDHLFDFRLKDAPKIWGKDIYGLLFQGEKTELAAKYTGIKSKQFDCWKKKAIHLYQEIVRDKNSFAAANLGLVGSVVKKMQFDSSLNIAFEDLIQEGCFGLMRAIDKFDYAKKLKFSTYAVWWVRHFVQRYVYDKNCFIRMPAHSDDIRSKVEEFKENFVEANGHLPSKEEVIAGTGLSKLTLDNTAALFKVVTKDIENDYAWVAEDKPSPLDRLIAIEEKKSVELALSKLSLTEKEILFQRFEQEKSLNDISKEIGLSREGTRQIQLRALNKIKNSLFEYD